MSEQKIGVYQKFIVTRTDGKSEKGQKHDDCAYFVLDLNHDVHARAAIDAYAHSCKDEYPELAKDLRIASMECPHLKNTGRHVEVVFPEKNVWDFVAWFKRITEEQKK
jgi:hypothetical protein